MTQPLLRLEGVTKVYRMGQVEVPALRGVDLTIDPGAFLAIMGPSGSGKSTLLQTFNLMPTLSALENVELPLVFQGERPRKRRQRAAQLLALVGLADRQRHRPGQLSGGERQRVAIARALASDPQLILADEPTGNLDSASGREILEVLRDLNGRGKTLVLVTHDVEAAKVARNILRMRDGRIEGEA